MAPTPYSMNGRLQLSYTVNSLIYHANFPVSWDGSIVSPMLFSKPAGTFSVDPSTLAAQIWSLAKPLFSSGVLAPVWTFLEYNAGDFIPRSSGTTAGGAGTNATPAQAAGILTITFKDVLNRLVKVEFFETSVGVPFHGTTGSSTLINNFASDYVDTGTLGTMGASIYSKGGGDVTIPKNYTTDLSRSVRRRRGLL